jgi:hypothetical protein
MHFIIHLFLLFCVIVIYINVLKQLEYHDVSENNSFFIDYTNNKALQQLCDKNKILIFESPCDIQYNNNIHLSNTTDDETIHIPFNAFEQLMLNTETTYYSNYTPISSEHSDLSKFIINPFSLYTRCHLLGGPCGFKTQNMLHNSDRKFLYVYQGSLHVYIQPRKPEHFYHTDLEKFQYSIGDVESELYEQLELHSGQIMFIPHNYVYCIEYREPTNIVFDITSHSVSSLCIHIPDLVLHTIQKNNIIVKDVDDDIINDVDNGSENVVESTNIHYEEKATEIEVNDNIDISS